MSLQGHKLQKAYRRHNGITEPYWNYGFSFTDIHGGEYDLSGHESQVAPSICIAGPDADNEPFELHLHVDDAREMLRILNDIIEVVDARNRVQEAAE